MASTITVTCPECDKQLKAPDDVLGKKIRCKFCEATFVARAGKAAAASKPTAAKKPADKPKAKPTEKPKAAPAAAKDEEDDDAAPYGVTHEYLGRRCPNCTEPLDDEQRVCLECGYDTMTRARARTVKVKDTTGGDVFLWLLPGILCVFLFIIVLTTQLLFIFLITEETFGDVWYDFLGGKFAKIYSSLFTLFVCYKSARFAVTRLIFNNKPPEHEDKSRDDDEEEED